MDRLLSVIEAERKELGARSEEVKILRKRNQHLEIELAHSRDSQRINLEKYKSLKGWMRRNFGLTNAQFTEMISVEHQ